MIDEKYRRNPENITDFLKEEKFRYICKMEFEYKNEKYKEIEQCDVFLERIEKFEIEKAGSCSCSSRSKRCCFSFSQFIKGFLA